MTRGPDRARTDRFVRATGWLLVAMLLGFMVFCGVWRLTGGRWERVETASMGTVAPVNTLLWVEPTDFDKLEVGDFITFHPPGHPDVTYSHRVAVVNSDGTIGTKGQITSPDPWQLTSKDLVGKVVMRWKGVGWLIVAAPVLLIGGALLWLVVWRMRDVAWKLPVTIVGASLILSVAIVIYRPLIQAEQLGFGAVDGGARATYVSTGLLPVRLQAYRGEHADLYDGEVGSVLVTQRDKHGRFGITMHPHIPFWWWIILILVCFIPALWTLAIGLPPQVEPKRRASGS